MLEPWWLTTTLRYWYIFIWPSHFFLGIYYACSSGKKPKKGNIKTNPNLKSWQKYDLVFTVYFTTSHNRKLMFSSDLNSRFKSTKWVPVLCSLGLILSDGDRRFHFGVSNSIKPDTLHLLLTWDSRISFNNSGQPYIFIMKSFPVHQ